MQDCTCAPRVLNGFGGRAGPGAGWVRASSRVCWGPSPQGGDWSQSLVWTGGYIRVVFAGQLDYEEFFNLLPLCWNSGEYVCVQALSESRLWSHSSPTLPVINPTSFQNLLRGLIFPVPVPKSGVLNVCSIPSLLRQDLQMCDIPSAYGLSAGGVGLYQIVFLPLLPISICFSLYILNCRKVVLLAFRLFSENCCVCSCSFGVS